MTSIQWILLILCIAAVMLYVRGLETLEGFLVQPVQGELPEVQQASMIPRDSAGASTTNPQLAKPDYRDWVAARESFQYFLDIYTPDAALISGRQHEVTEMLLEAPRYLSLIKGYIRNPEAVPSRDLLDRGAEAQELANAMRRVGPAEPTGVCLDTPALVLYSNDNLMS